jgi:rhamnose transport system permease protein
VLALVLVGILRFGMGLINIQGQVQDIVIGLMLILSILLPRLGSRLTAGLSWHRRVAVLKTGLAVVVVVLFGFFFFWSRTQLPQ